MALITIKCPNCSAEKKMTLLESDYKGPYSCWKCHSMFSIVVKNRQLESYLPLARETWQQQQDLEAKTKGRRSND